MVPEPKFLILWHIVSSREAIIHDWLKIYWCLLSSFLGDLCWFDWNIYHGLNTAVFFDIINYQYFENPFGLSARSTITLLLILLLLYYQYP